MRARRKDSHLFSGISGIDEWLFTAVFISFLVTGLAGFVLAEAGFFRAWILIAVVGAFSLFVALALGQTAPRLRPVLKLLYLWPSYPQRQSDSDRRYTMIGRAMLLGLVILAAALFARPAEMLRGALDSGVYVNSGVALGRTGSIFQRDLLMRQLNDDVGEGKQLLQELNPDRYTLTRLKLTGFYVYDKQAALVLPQHYSLYPVWIGLLYDLFGIWGALYATPLLALLAVLSFYYFARRVITEEAALLALMLLVLCPVTIWFARYPVSEVITSLLAFGAFSAFGGITSYELRVTSYELLPAFGGITSYESGVTDYESGGADDASPEDARSFWGSLWGVIAGVALGEIALARPDFFAYLLPVPLYLLYWRLTRRWRRPQSWFAASLGVMLALFILHFTFFTFGYTMDLYYNVIQGVRRNAGLLLPALYVGVMALVALDRLYPRVYPFWVRLEAAAVRYRRLWVGAIVVVVAAYILYHYAYLPWQPDIRFDKAGNPIAQAVVTTWESYIGAPVDQGSQYNLLRVGWYLSPVGVVLGGAGLLRLIWSRLNAATGLFFGCLFVLGYLFIQETYTEAHYIYSMRRYITVIVPATLLGYAWLCQLVSSRLHLPLRLRPHLHLPALPHRLGAVIAALLALALALFFIYTSRVIIPHVEEGGAVAQFSSLASNFQPADKSVVLLSNERDEPNLVATPLQYIYGIESFVVNRGYPEINNTLLEGIVMRWMKQGYKVYVMMGANGGKLRFDHLKLQPVGSWDYSVPELEQLYYQKPSNVSSAYLPWGIYSVVSGTTQPLLPFNLDIGDMDYPSLVGGFYKQEQDTPGAPLWRWTGGEALVRLPWPTSADGKTLGAATVTLSLRPETPVQGKPPRRTEPLTVTLSLDDTPIGRVVLPPASPFKEYTIAVPAGMPREGSEGGYALLKISAPTWSGEEAGISYDTRRLGVQVEKVEVR